MLEIVIVFAIYVALQKLMDKPFERRIREAQTVEQALEQRKRLKHVRTAFFAIYLIAYIGFSFWISFGVGEQDANTIATSIKGLCMSAIMLYQYLSQQKKYKEFMGNVSTFGKEDYLSQHDHFALFLRGFNEDDYAKEEALSKATNLEKFSEYKFMDILQKKIPACAIGMTKEADSPYGATRVYVNDISWKADVHEMMEKADEIYILVNDRTSCIWEIEQSIEMLQKTLFIIDDRTKYEHVRDSVKEKLLLPEIPVDMSEATHLVLRYHQGIPHFDQYDNSIESYANILQMPVPDNPQKALAVKRKKFKKGCIWAIGIIFAVILIIVGISYCSNRNNNETWEAGYTDDEEDIELTSFTYYANDNSFSVESTEYFQQLEEQENQKLALYSSNKKLGVTITYEPKEELVSLEVNTAKDYAMAIYRTYLSNKLLSDVKLLGEDEWSRGACVGIIATIQDNQLCYNVYTTLENNSFVQITFIYPLYATMDVSPIINEISESFKFL